ncbi:MAG: hypothetical protein IT349_10505 [Candidatus Eisenbacteria bacterium]|nr:hypothetical protein [Candidatus Eisenbacteria bacterium]MCC7142520.1 hypothetical protein [Candidatus Eisenbacteria bacterium]
MRSVGIAAVLALTLAYPIRPSHGRESTAPRIVAIDAGRQDSLLVCTIRLEGVPDRRSRDTLASGLPAALSIALMFEDENGRIVHSGRVSVRLEPDLLGAAVRVRTPLWESTLSDLSALQASLETLGPLPVAELADLGGAGRIHALLAIHPLAPDEVAWARDLLTGEVEEAPDGRREVSVGVGTLFRYFLGRGDRTQWVSEARSDELQLDRLEAASPALER